MDYAECYCGFDCFVTLYFRTLYEKPNFLIEKKNPSGLFARMPRYNASQFRIAKKKKYIMKYI